MRQLFLKIRRVIVAAVYGFFALVRLGLSPSTRRALRGTWLFGERLTEARDNAFHLFAYVRRHHPEIKAKYLIGPSSSDYGKVAQIGECVKPDSLSHYMHWFMARFLIATDHGYITPRWGWWSRLIPRNRKRTRSIMLQHGVTAIRMHRIMFASWSPHALITTVSDRERQLLIETGGHESTSVRTLGFARYDALKANSQTVRQILYMPTWRRWLDPKRQPMTIFKPPQDARLNFRSSTYFKAISALIHHPELRQVLAEAGYELIFYPHPQMQQFTNVFDEPRHPVRICSAEEHDLGELIRKSHLLVTDFSSVTFDFAYMGRSTIYYQFDEQQFFAGIHDSQKAYFDLHEDGFGPVAATPDDVISEIARLTQGVQQGNQPPMPSKYKQRADSFFRFQDEQNCARIFEWLREAAADEEKESAGVSA